MSLPQPTTPSHKDLYVRTSGGFLRRRHKPTRRQKEQIRLQVYLRDEYTCQLCGRRRKSDDLTLDHIIPYRYGGPFTFENLRAACAYCNISRGARY